MSESSHLAANNNSTSDVKFYQHWRWLGLGFLVLLLDRLTKYVVVSELAYGDRIQILPFFAWVRWHNSGAAFSFLADAGGWQRWFFIVLGIGFCIYILWEMSRLRPSEKMLACVYALILGGALGNLWGRMANGYVVDFILVHYQEHIFPAFNVADSALFCGVALWMILIFREHRAQE
tara:strand:+ start:547 stop:1077 length:531 start_codon:yes stop_codon:yes gene_type:complete